MNILERKYWIFDLDGTLTVAIHDFEAIRRELDLSPDKPILEQLQKLPEGLAAPRRDRLDEIELELVGRARAQEGVREALAALHARGTTFGILTRNNKINALATLRVCGLAEYFRPDHVIGRDCAEPKPSGAGIRHLLALWGAAPDEAVMVGDYLFDLLAGRDAGTATVYVDPDGTAAFSEWADVSVAHLDEIEGLSG